MSEAQTNLAWDVLLDLDRFGTGPRHERLSRALRSAIRGGTLAPGVALPPSRALASDLGCSRWVVTQAYAQLVAEGYLQARTGSATRVCWSPDQPTERRSTGTTFATAPRHDLAPGLPDLRAFPRARWAEAVRGVLSETATADLGLPAAEGHSRLRTVLAEYLRRARGAQASTREIRVCAGVTDAVTQISRALRAAGVTAVAVEDPGWPRLRAAVAAEGLRVVAVPVDEEGLRVDYLAERTDVRAVIVTPAHQFPAGVVLSPQRRAALLEWAGDVDGLILEDDYDAEFRYDRKPVGTLQGLQASRVALLGSVSKTLTPALGLGWCVLPPRWRDPLRDANPTVPAPPTVDQLAFAAFIEHGGYDRHLRRVRLRYRARRDRLVAELARLLPDVRLSGVAAGLHLIAHLPPTTDAAAVARAAERAGVRVMNLDAYRYQTEAGAQPGLVLGYGNLADTAVDSAVRILAEKVTTYAS